MEKKNRVEELSTEIIELREKIKTLRAELDEATYLDRVAQNEKYVGKAFIEKCDEVILKGWVRCYFVKSVDVKNAKLEVLELRYYTDSNHNYSIEDSSFFKPVEALEEDTVVEITFEEFKYHFARVNGLIYANLPKP